MLVKPAKGSLMRYVKIPNAKPIKKAFNFLSPQEKKKYLFFLSLRSLAGLLDVLGVFMIGLIAASVAGLSSGETIGKISNISLLEALPSGQEGLLILVVIALTLFSCKSLFSLLLTKNQQKLLATSETKTASVMYSGLLRSGIELQSRWTSQELAYALNPATNYLFNGILGSFANIITEAFLLTIIGISLFIYNPAITIGVIIYFAALAISLEKIVGKRHGIFGAAQATSQIVSSSMVTESMAAYREIFAYGKRNYFTDLYSINRSNYSISTANINFISAIPRYTVELSLIFGISILVISQVLLGNLIAGAATLGIFLTASMRITGSLLPLQASSNLISQSISLAKPAFDLFSQLQTWAEKRYISPDTQIDEGDISTSNGLDVQVRNVTHSYIGSEKESISNLNLNVHPGEFVAFIGPSGSGKSTTADLILGIIEPTQGLITVSGFSPRELDSALPGSIAYVPQRPGILHASILQNVAFGIPEEDISVSRVQFCLEQTGLLDHVINLPDGLDTTIDSKNTSLSGGQIQRIGLARALYGNPKLIILDEATSALDAYSESKVSQAISTISQKITLIVIAHRLSTIQHADKVYVFEHGKITASGTFDELKSESKLVADYIKLMKIK